MTLRSSLRDCISCRYSRLLARHGVGGMVVSLLLVAGIIAVIIYSSDFKLSTKAVVETDEFRRAHWPAVTTRCQALIRQNPLVSHFRKVHHEQHLHAHPEVELSGEELCHEYRYSSTIPRRPIPNVFDATLPPHSFFVSYVTHLTSDRLDRLHEVADFWTGPMSAAVYVKEEHITEIDKLLCQFPLLSHRRDIFIHLVPERGDMYPINYLRNVALQNAKTDYVFLADVDFVPMPDLHNKILTDILKMGRQTKTAMVVPAFEAVQGMELSDQNRPHTKEQLLDLMDEGVIEPFHYSGFFHGHKPTNFTRWEQTDKPYEVHWQRWYEPYVVTKRQWTPHYEEAFVERGFDKSSFIMHLAALKFHFLILPDVFIIHIPHHEDNVERFKEKGLNKCAKETYEKFKLTLKEKYKFHEEFHMQSFGHLDY